MKVMFTTSPGLGHSLSLVPLIWAVRAAGHDVLVGSSGGSLHAVGRAGLPAVDGYPHGDIKDLFGVHERKAAEDGFHFLAFLGGLFGDMSDQVTDQFVAAAKAFQPDLVVHSSLEYGGAVAARVLDVPEVVYHLGPPVPAPIRDAVREGARGAAERHGVASWPTEPVMRLDPMPTSTLDEGTPQDHLIRFVPYSGGDAARPAWMLSAPADRPRVCVTLGTEVPRWAGLDVITEFVAAAEDLDVELVLGLGGASPETLGDLPPNVRAYSWIPIAEIAPTCAAIVHHGGAATMLTACATGIPQCVVPHGGDQFMHAPMLAKRGVALVLETHEVDGDAIRETLPRLVSDPDLRRAAAEVRDEMAAYPSPAAVVPALEALARP